MSPGSIFAFIVRPGKSINRKLLVLGSSAALKSWLLSVGLGTNVYDGVSTLVAGTFCWTKSGVPVDTIFSSVKQRASSASTLANRKVVLES
jgi:hypothetical protein